MAAISVKEVVMGIRSSLAGLAPLLFSLGAIAAEQAQLVESINL
jgi:hypothetical protein